MRPRTILILLIVVVGLVAFIELYEHELPSSDERAELEKRLLDLEGREIVSVRIERGSDSVRLQRNEENGVESTWRLVVPFDAPANNDEVARLIKSLIDLEKKRTLTGSSRGEVGLAPPRLIATLSTADAEVRLSVGSELPMGDTMMVAVDDADEIHIVDDGVWADLSRKPGDWRFRSVFPVVPEEIERVVLDGREGRLELVRRGTDLWLASPLVDRVDSEKAESLLVALAAMEVDTFIDGVSEPSLRVMGLDPPESRVAVHTGETGSAIVLAWGRPVQEDPGDLSYARIDDQVFQTDSEFADFLSLPLADWRSRALTSLKTFQIDSIEVDQEGQDPMTLIREGAIWHRNGETISFRTVSDLLYAISDLRAVHLEDQADGESTSVGDLVPGAELTLKSSDSEQRIRFLPDGEKEVLAKVDGRDVRLIVGRKEFTEILDILAAVRAAESSNGVVNQQQSDGETQITSDQ